jgi:DNA-binding NtrC family response regulator
MLKDVSARILTALAVILIKVPSLNERREDIPLLISIFTDKLLEHGNAKKKFSKDAVNTEYDWTGEAAHENAQYTGQLSLSR